MQTTNLRLITGRLEQALRQQIVSARGIYWIVSFIMESGVELLLTTLQEANARGADIKILTGDYLFITEPQALRTLRDALPQAELRLWYSRGRSFHPKAYLFENAVDERTVIVGSSNWSGSALTSGVEWNVWAQGDEMQALEQFMGYFYADNTSTLSLDTIDRYAHQWQAFHDSHASHQWEAEWRRQEAQTLSAEDTGMPDDGASGESATDFSLRPAQHEAFEALQQSRQQGYSKALVVLPTGLGKTYLAAFFAQSFRRVLFIAHREEILRQAVASFERVGDWAAVAQYTGKEMDTKAPMICASVFTLSRKVHRERFSPEHFDLIIVDEFHHAAARSYQSLLNYYRPQFVLGLTATPDRTDGRDIAALCDGHVAYELPLTTAIGRGWLAPFWYYGIYDPIDYGSMHWRNNHYDEEQLWAAQYQASHADVVFRAWSRHRQSRTLAFCSSVRHAEFLANAFRERGVTSVSLHAASGGAARQAAIRNLQEGKLEVIFTVDLFNEGVDIPSVDTILLVRPTSSSIVYLQQVGRGLRLYVDKQHCVVIDLIGNYRNADAKLRWLAGVNEESALVNRSQAPWQMSLPPGCRLDLDVQVIDVLRRMERAVSRKGQLMTAYRQLKDELDRRPSYYDFVLHTGYSAQIVRQVFGSYVEMLKVLDQLDSLEEQVATRYQSWFREVEHTVMSKSYKMVLLQSMLQRGQDRWWTPIEADQAAPFFHQYIMARAFRRDIDFADKKTKKLWTYDKKAVARLIKEMPMTKWAQSSPRWVVREGSSFAMRLDPPENFHERTSLYTWTHDVVDVRLHEYFVERRQKP